MPEGEELSFVERQTRAEVDAMSSEDVAACCKQLVAEDGMPPLPPNTDDAGRREALLQHFCPMLQLQPPPPRQQQPLALHEQLHERQQDRPAAAPPPVQAMSEHPDVIFRRYDHDRDGLLSSEELHELVKHEIVGHSNDSIEGILDVIMLECGFLDGNGEATIPQHSFPALWELVCTALQSL